MPSPDSSARPLDAATRRPPARIHRRRGAAPAVTGLRDVVGAVAGAVGAALGAGRDDAPLSRPAATAGSATPGRTAGRARRGRPEAPHPGRRAVAPGVPRGFRRGDRRCPRRTGRPGDLGIGAGTGGLSAARWFAPASLLTLPIALGAETVLVAGVEVVLIGELHELYGRPATGDARSRAAAYVASWSEQRVVDGAGDGGARLRCSAVPGCGRCATRSRGSWPARSRTGHRSCSVQHWPDVGTAGRRRPWPSGSGPICVPSGRPTLAPERTSGRSRARAAGAPLGSLACPSPPCPSWTCRSG